MSDSWKGHDTGQSRLIMPRHGIFQVATMKERLNCGLNCHRFSGAFRFAMVPVSGIQCSSTTSRPPYRASTSPSGVAKWIWEYIWVLKVLIVMSYSAWVWGLFVKLLPPWPVLEDSQLKCLALNYYLSYTDYAYPFSCFFQVSFTLLLLMFNLKIKNNSIWRRLWFYFLNIYFHSICNPIEPMIWRQRKLSVNHCLPVIHYRLQVSQWQGPGLWLHFWGAWFVFVDRAFV